MRVAARGAAPITVETGVDRLYGADPIFCQIIMLSRIKAWAQSVRTDVHAIYFAARDPRVPWIAKAVAIVVAAYALSPLDLVPDFIPVLGYLDDLIILPLGIWLVIALVPADVMADCRAKARAEANYPTSKAGVAAIIVLWIASAVLTGWLGYRYWIRS